MKPCDTIRFVVQDGLTANLCTFVIDRKLQTVRKTSFNYVTRHRNSSFFGCDLTPRNIARRSDFEIGGDPYFGEAGYLFWAAGLGQLEHPKRWLWLGHADARQVYDLNLANPSLWLGHADTRQVYDLNLANLRYGSAMPMRGKSPTCRRRSLVPLAVYDRGQRPPKCLVGQVGDLPRIGMAEPLTE